MKTCSQCQVKYPDVLEFCPRDGSPLPPGPDGGLGPVDPLLNTTIDGRYAIEARLGEGGMGVVYRARHVLIDKPVAIKILRKEAAQDAASVQRFIQEAKSASKINHSNIVDITDFGVLSDGHAYFVMEFLQGQTLAQAVGDGPLDPARVCSIGAQMARGLAAAHKHGIVHRDLKPENIFLLEREGQQDFVKIVDFGIAKVGGGQKLTQVGMVLGTPEYMSPEQATGQETDPRVDQYALGCIMYEMLTKEVPFTGDRPAQILTKHVFEALMPARQRRPDLNIPQGLDAVIARTLAKKPGDRFPTMRELEQALCQVEAEMRGGRVMGEESRMMSSASIRQQAIPTPMGQQMGQPMAQIDSQRHMSGAATQGYPQQYPGYGAPSGPGVPYAAQPMASGAAVAYPSPQGYQPNQSGMQSSPGMQPMPSMVYKVGPPGYASGYGLQPASYPPGQMPGQIPGQMPGQMPGQLHAGPPTRENASVGRTRRIRSIFAAASGVLLVVICVLLYSLLTRHPPVQQPEIRDLSPSAPVPPPVPPGTTDVGRHPQGTETLRSPGVQPEHPPPGPSPQSPARVEISIASTPSGATVLVDGKQYGKTPYRLVWQRGVSFELELRRSRYQTQILTVQSDQDREVQVVLPHSGGGRSVAPRRRVEPQTPPPSTPPAGEGMPLRGNLRDPFRHNGAK